MAGPADDGALGCARSGSGQGQCRRNRARLQGCLPHAQSAHRHLYVTAGARARSTDATTQARRNRHHRQRGRGDVRRIVAEALGTALLLTAVIGSGIMAAKLAGGNGALALLCNTLPTGAILAVLILIFGPVSGAHLNPAVSLAFVFRRELPPRIALVYLAAQIAGAIAGAWLAHLMFELPVFQISSTMRVGAGQWIAEAVATLGLLLTIFGCLAG